MRTIRPLALICMLVLPAVTTADGDELPEKVRKDWAEREHKAARIEIKWKATETYSDEFLEINPPSAGVLRPKSLQYDYELLLDGNKFRYSRSSKRPLNIISREVSDGKQTFETVITPEEMRIQVRLIAAPRSLDEQFKLAAVSFHPIARLARPSISVLRGKPNAKLTVSEESLTGYPDKLLKVTEHVESPNGKRRTLWIEPATSNIVQAEDRDDDSIKSEFTIEYGRPEANWVPKSWHMKFGIRPRGALIEQKVTVDSVSFPAEIPAKEFALKLEPGTILWERGEAYRIGAEGKKVKIEEKDE